MVLDLKTILANGELLVRDGENPDGRALIDDDTFVSATSTNVPSAESTQNYIDNEIVALPSIEPEALSRITWTEGGSPPSATLTPVVVGYEKRLARHNAGTTLTSNAAETSILTTSLQIAANDVAIGDVLEIEAWGLMTQNVSASETNVLRFKVGGNTFFGTQPLTLTTAAAGARPWQCRIVLRVNSIPAFANVMGTITVGDPSGTTTIVNPIIRTIIGTDQSVTLSGALTLDISADHSSASSSMSTTLQAVTVSSRPST